MQWTKKIIEAGTSAGFYIPYELLEYLNLKIGDEIIVQDDTGKKGKFVSFWKKNKEEKENGK